jgi:hypothetical protein
VTIVPPNEIGKGAGSDPGAQDIASSLETSVCRSVYRVDAIEASKGRLRLIHHDRLRDKVLRRATRDVNRDRSTLPLWAFRLGQHVKAGQLPYRETWVSLQTAAIDGGASEAWTLRVLYKAIGNTMVYESEPMPFTVLAGGLI